LRLVGLRAAALAAAVLLAALSRGDAIVLAALLAVGAWRPLPAVAFASALAAAAWRWSSTALEDLAGAQAVLGPAGVVDPPASAVAAWLGALAIVLATPNLVEAWWFERADAGTLSTARPRWLARGLEWLPPFASAASAAVVVAGPAPGGDVWARALAVLVALAIARLVAGRRRVLDRHLVLDGVAVALGVGSLVAVAIDSPPVGDLFDAGALVEGLAIALAVGALTAAAGALGMSRGGDGRALEGAR
jgi:hypothetical protein